VDGGRCDLTPFSETGIPASDPIHRAGDNVSEAKRGGEAVSMEMSFTHEGYIIRPKICDANN
jgi:hypothetical protein